MSRFAAIDKELDEIPQRLTRFEGFLTRRQEAHEKRYQDLERRFTELRREYQEWKADMAKVIPIRPAFVDNTFTIGRTVSSPPTLTQRVLTNSDAAKRSFIGSGKNHSKVLVDASVTGKFITNDAETEDMEVCDLWIDGQRTIGETTSEVDLCDGVDLTGQFCTIERCLIERIQGSGVVLRSPAQTARHNHIKNCIYGVEAVAADSRAIDNIIEDTQSWGIYLPSGASHVYVSGNHCYGVKAGLYAIGNEVFSVGNVYADGHFGIRNTGSAGNFVGDFMYRNATRDMYINGPTCKASACDIKMMPKVDQSGHDSITGRYGLQVTTSGDYFSFIGGRIEMTADTKSGTTNPVVADAAISWAGDQGILDTRLLDNDGFNGSIGLVIPSAVKGFKVRLECYGFHDATAKIFQMEGGAASGSSGLDLEFRINDVDAGKAIADYFTIDAGWEGRIKIIDCAAGQATEVELTEGQAY